LCYLLRNASAGVIGINESFPSGAQTVVAHPICKCDIVPEIGNFGVVHAH